MFSNVKYSLLCARKGNLFPTSYTGLSNTCSYEKCPFSQIEEQSKLSKFEEEIKAEQEEKRKEEEERKERRKKFLENKSIFN